MAINNSVTFSMLDKGLIIKDIPPEDQGFRLQNWYASIRNTPIANFGIEDICTCCRQQIHLDYIIPLAIEALESNPIAGEMCDGELIFSIKCISKDFWIKHKEYIIRINKIIEDIKGRPEIDDDIKAEANSLLLSLKR